MKKMITHNLKVYFPSGHFLFIEMLLLDFFKD